jgi:hypothetical protein
MLIGLSSLEKYSTFCSTLSPKAENFPAAARNHSPLRVGNGRVDEDQIDIDFDCLIPVPRHTLLSTNDSRAQEGEREEDYRQEKARVIHDVGRSKRP